MALASACTKAPNSEVQPTSAAATGVDAEQLEIAENALTPRVCIDKLVDQADTGKITTNAVFVNGKKWANGKTLKIFFINGGDFLKGKVITYARKWADDANLHFVETQNRAESDIRVGFKLNGDRGSWSYIGTDANHPTLQGKQTMNFGWFDTKTEEKEFSRTIVHEFGHALGLGHEMLSPVEKINWDKPKVYAYYMGPPNNWTRAQVDNNIFNKYKPDEVRNTVFDPTSIMEYPVDPALTTDGKGIGWNYYLSNKDRNFIASIYPGAATEVGEPFPGF